MNTHPYLRAYVAGIFLPTLVMPLLLSAFVIVRLVLMAPVPIERAVIFPMAVVPSVFGLWNMAYLWSHTRTHLPIGIHGALLPFVLAPLGALLATCLGVLVLGPHGARWFEVFQVPYGFVACGFLVALTVYYLVWKYVVGSLNRVLGIA